MQVQRDWETVTRLIGRLPVDATEADAVCKARDADALDALMQAVEHPEPVAEAVVREVSEEEMVFAMRAFRKRLKLSRLADESKLGGRQLTGGRQSQIDAIIPPSQFSREVWHALAKKGQLEHTGQGFFQLIAK